MQTGPAVIRGDHHGARKQAKAGDHNEHHRRQADTLISKFPGRIMSDHDGIHDHHDHEACAGSNGRNGKPKDIAGMVLYGSPGG